MVSLNIRTPAFDVRVPDAPVSTEEDFFASAVHNAAILHRFRTPITAQNLAFRMREYEHTAVEDLFATEKFRQALKGRGLLIEGESQALTAKQLSFLAIYLDMSVPMTHAQRLKAAKVSQPQFDGWCKQPEFAAELETLAEERVVGLKPLVFTKLADAIDKGERWALEMQLEITGRHDRRQASVDVGKLLTEFYGILDEELSQVAGGDAALERIGGRLRSLMQQGVNVQTITVRSAPTPQIEG